MAVYKRGETWHIGFRYEDPVTGLQTRFRRSCGPLARSRRDAEALEREWRREAETPPPPAAAETTTRKRAAFSGFAKHWLELKCPDWKPSYHETCEYVLRVHLVPFFGDADLRDITPEMVQTFKARKAQEVGEKSVNNFMATFSSLMNCAIDWGYAEINPFRRVKMFRVLRTDAAFWDAPQADAFLDTARRLAPAWVPFFLCALRTGMRVGELLALTWDDVDFVHRKILVRRNWTHGKLVVPKSGKERKIAMSPELMAALKEHRHLKGDLVFCQEDGSYLTYEHIRWWLYRVQRAAGIPRITAARHAPLVREPARDGRGSPRRRPGAAGPLRHRDDDAVRPPRAERDRGLRLAARRGRERVLDTKWPQRGLDREVSDGKCRNHRKSRG
jgi:integrase